MARQKRPVVTDVTEVVVDGRPVRLVVAEEEEGSRPLAPRPLEKTREILDRVPAVRDLPRWEDGGRP
ncbi:hypothetical protein [Thermoflexus hugenholtzii]